jgi:molecular chaperone GrpE
MANENNNENNNDNDNGNDNAAELADETAASVAVEGEADTTSEAEALLVAAQEEIAALRDQLLRLAADFDNYRKRATREQQDIRDYGTSQLLQDILPVLDNLDRALAHSEGDTSPVVKGVRLVAKQFADTLTRYGVQSFASVGVPFDPERHEAVAQMAVEGKKAGTILEEMQKGYMLRERLLRPAQVVVASAPPESNTSETAH